MFSAIRKRVKVEIVACDKIDQSKCLIYIHDYIIPDIEYYGSELKKEYNLTYMQKTTLIKTKNTTSTPLLQTFKGKENPGEQAKTKAYKY